MASVEVIRDTQTLARLKGDWQALAASCQAATVFQTWEWNAAWWRYYGSLPGRRLCLIAMRDAQGALVGLAPLHTRFWRRTPIRSLSFLGTGQSEYLDILAAPGWESEVAATLYAHLSRSRNWLIAEWPALRAGAILRQHPPSASVTLPFWDAEGGTSPYLALPKTDELWAQSLGKPRQLRLAAAERALRRVYETEFRTLAPDETSDAAMLELFELHERRWNAQGQPGVFRARRLRAFHGAAAAELHGRGWLRIFTLCLDGRTEAVWYGSAYGGRMLYLQSGFEPTLARWSLGTLLTAFAIRSAIREGCAAFDFLTGDGGHAARWRPQTHRSQRRVLVRFAALRPLVQRTVGRAKTASSTARGR